MSEHDRPISYQPDTMVPALDVVGGTPKWAVRRIITRRSPPASHASHRFAVLAPLRDRLLQLYVIPNQIGIVAQIDSAKKTLSKYYNKAVESIRWVIFEGFRFNWLKCMFCCDNFNRIYYLRLIAVILLLLSMPVIWFKTTFPDYIRFILLTIIFIVIVIAIYVVYPDVKNRKLIEKSLKFAQTNSEFRADGSDGAHHGIFFIMYEDQERKEYAVDSIKLLGEGLKNLGQSYKIYPCRIPGDFRIPYVDPKVTHLWIIGHGTKSSLFFDNSQKLPYSELPVANPKEFIAQLHCNTGNGDSLIKINKAKAGFVTDYYRVSHQNRCYILCKLRNYQKTGKW